VRCSPEPTPNGPPRGSRRGWRPTRNGASPTARSGSANARCRWSIWSPRSSPGSAPRRGESPGQARTRSC
jgi:hypothetical protein